MQTLASSLYLWEKATTADRNLRADNAMAAKNFFSWLNMCIEPPPREYHLRAGQFRHHAIGIHATGEHMTMVAVGGDRITGLDADCRPTTTASPI